MSYMATPLSRSGPSVVDRMFQLAYVCAYQLMRTYWTLRKPTTHGALVTVWNRNELLLVRNSYVRYYSLPGGYLHQGESGAAAARRELAEEVGIQVAPEQLSLLHEETHVWQGKQDHVQIFMLEVESRPQVQVDYREVVEASWWPIDQALKLDLFPPLRRALERRQREMATTKH